MTPAPPLRVAPGTVLAGRYTLVEVLGEGGMGTVWRADQTAPVARPVAVKLVKQGMDTRQVLARFEAADIPATTEADRLAVSLAEVVRFAGVCPQCRTPGTLPAAAVGQRVACRCGRAFVFPWWNLADAPSVAGWANLPPSTTADLFGSADAQPSGSSRRA